VKVLHINTYDSGGAANACFRLHEGLRAEGIDSHLLVLETKKTINCLHSFLDILGISKWKKTKKRFIDSFKYRFKLKTTKDTIASSYIGIKHSRDKRLDLFSCPYSIYDITESTIYKEADIIHLHWVAGFVDLPSFFKKNKKPVIWTLHDMFPLTGCMHYTEKHLGLSEYGTPKLKISSYEEESFQTAVTELLQEPYAKANINIVTPSKWLQNEVKQNTLLKSKPLQLIRNGFNTSIFKHDTNAEFQSTSIKILFVADNVLLERKGFDYFLGAIESILVKRDDIEVLCAGSGLSPLLLKDKRFKLLGRIESDVEMAKLYNESDLFVIPSLMDNLPNTMIESLLCGTPVVGFPVGGINEIIQPGINGVLADNISVVSLSKAIENAIALFPSFNRKEIAENAMFEFNLAEVTKQYISLYSEKIKF